MTVLTNDQFQRLASTLDQSSQLFAGLSTQDVAQVEKIFMRNCASGRAARVMHQTALCPPVLDLPANAWDSPLPASELLSWQLAYLQRVVCTYRQEAPRLHALAQGDQTAWHALSLRLVGSAYKLLLWKSFAAATAAELAPDLAQQTCLRIYLSFFPCDVAFETWAYMILKDQILQRSVRLEIDARHVE